MSFDSYFCVCCLSTNDLMDLFGNNDGEIYIDLLKNNFAIEISREEFYEASYICNSCCNKLKDTNKFRITILQTIHTMEVNGLIKLEKIKDYTVIKKIDDLDLLLEDKEKVNLQAHDVQEIAFNITIENINTNQIKEENIDEKFFELLQDSEELIKSDLSNLLVGQNQITHSKRQNYQDCNLIEQENSFNKQDKATIDQVTSTTDHKEITTDQDKDTTDQNQDQATNSQPLYKISKDLKCEMCSLQLPNINVYQGHMNEHFSDHICEVCGKGFANVKRLKRHKNSHKIGVFKCSYCDVEFSNYNTMQSHKSRMHGKQGMYKCSRCDIRFTTFHRRVVHFATVHGETERKYKCSMCPSEFMTSGNLSSHIREKHFKVKRYICSECDKGFFQKQDLRSHMQSHTGVKEFQCTTCLKAFLRKKALTVHMRIHTNEKRFSCDLCGTKYIQKCSLRNHLKVHEKRSKAIKHWEADNFQ